MTTLKILLILLIAQLQNCYGQSINADSLLNRFRNDIQIEQRIYWGKVKMDVETMESYYTLLNCASVNNLIK
jgi:elongation factor P--beta-lysine ligase